MKKAAVRKRRIISFVRIKEKIHRICTLFYHPQGSITIAG